MATMKQNEDKQNTNKIVAVFLEMRPAGRKSNSSSLEAPYIFVYCLYLSRFVDAPTVKCMAEVSEILASGFHLFSNRTVIKENELRSPYIL
jgi:hypothetical protein